MDLEGLAYTAKAFCFWARNGRASLIMALWPFFYVPAAAIGRYYAGCRLLRAAKRCGAYLPYIYDKTKKTVKISEISGKKYFFKSLYF